MGSVIESKVPMPIYNIYFLIGAAITCFIEYIIMFCLGEGIEFTYLGIICAFLLLCFEVFLLLSIQQIGVGYATGFSVFSASVITPIVQIILGQPIAIPSVMVLGLIMLASSVFTMSVLKDILKYFEQNFGVKIPEQSPAPNQPQVTMAMENGNCYGEELETLHENTPLISNKNSNDDEMANDAMQISRCSMLLGLTFSSLAGIFMAILPLPSLYAAPFSAGLNFFLSFGIGCLIVIPLSGIIIIFTENDKEDKRAYGVPYNLLYRMISFDEEIWRYKQVVIPAVSAGIVWSIGNICGFCAFMYLSYTIAVSFVQCNVIVAMFLGVVLWKEITNKIEILMLFVLSLVLVAGCAVVVYGVFGSF